MSYCNICGRHEYECGCPACPECDESVRRPNTLCRDCEERFADQYERDTAADHSSEKQP